jgi:hypothetical protein
MKYCFNCNRITPGEPLFCNVCGCSYDWKLCPRHHRNPRTAEACSQCGSRDLSIPQPRRPMWVLPLGFLVAVVPGGLLTVGSVLILDAVFIAVLQQPGAIVLLVILAIPLGILWAMWLHIPSWFRTWVYRLLKRRRERHEGGAD